MTETKNLNAADFEPYIHTQFKIDTDALGLVDAELIEVTKNKYEKQESFSLIFSTPKDQIFEQKIYTIKHPQMGAMDLFIVPVASTQKDRMHYQVVFSRLLEK